MEAVSQSAAELAGMGEESKWAALEGGSEVDDELAMMKAQLSGAPEPSAALPASDEIPETTSTASALDEELEQLRKDLNQ